MQYEKFCCVCFLKLNVEVHISRTCLKILICLANLDRNTIGTMNNCVSLYLLINFNRCTLIFLASSFTYQCKKIMGPLDNQGVIFMIDNWNLMCEMVHHRIISRADWLFLLLAAAYIYDLNLIEPKGLCAYYVCFQISKQKILHNEHFHIIFIQ